jgi:hypothetical protein
MPSRRPKCTSSSVTLPRASRYRSVLYPATNRAIPLSHFERKGRIEPLDRLVRAAALVADDPRVSDPVIGRGCARQHWFFEPLRGRMAVVATTGGAVSAVLCGSCGIRWMTISPCDKRNYGGHNNLRSMAGKNLKTRSNTSRLSPPCRRPSQLYRFRQLASTIIHGARYKKRRARRQALWRYACRYVVTSAGCPHRRAAKPRV